MPHSMSCSDFHIHHYSSIYIFLVIATDADNPGCSGCVSYYTVSVCYQIPHFTGLPFTRSELYQLQSYVCYSTSRHSIHPVLGLCLLFLVKTKAATPGSVQFGSWEALGFPLTVSHRDMTSLTMNIMTMTMATSRRRIFLKMFLSIKRLWRNQGLPCDGTCLSG